MRIAIISQYYPPDPPSWIPAGLALGLRDRGHEVKVLTTYPHYETGRIAPGYRQRWRDIRVEDGVTVCRVAIVPSHSSNAFGRIANYVSFAWSSRLARAFVADCDVAYVYATPMTVAEGPRAWSKSLDLPFVLHVQDLWPESVTGSGILPKQMVHVVQRCINWWLARVYRRAAVTVAIAPRMRTMLEARGVHPTRSRVVLNWSNDADHLVPDIRAKGTQGGISLLYAGNLGQMQDVGTIIEAVATLDHLENLVLRVAGSGVQEAEIRALAARLGAVRVEFLGRLSAAQIAGEYARADFQLVTLKNLDIFEGTLPSKFAAGLAHGVPVITNIAGDMSDMVVAAQLGFTAEPGGVQALAAAIETAYRTSSPERQQMSANARAYYDQHMSKSAGVAAIEAALMEAVAANRKERQ